jgi:hypothetical protein
MGSMARRNGSDDRTGGEATLLDLVQIVSEITHDEKEIVATVLHLLKSGRVHLRGEFCEGEVAPTSEPR